MSGSNDHNSGILAIWNDCAAGHEAEYEAWYQREHLFERLGVPGFVLGRRYEAVRADAQYFTHYETVTPQVLKSPAYLERVCNPSPLTTRIMSRILTNMSRTVCQRTVQHGTMRGAYGVTAKLDGRGQGEALGELPADIARHAGVARSEAWISVEDISPVTSREEALRGGDAKIAACLFVETLRETDACEIEAEIAGRLTKGLVEVGIYRLMCELTNTEFQS